MAMSPMWEGTHKKDTLRDLSWAMAMLQWQNSYWRKGVKGQLEVKEDNCIQPPLSENDNTQEGM